MVYECEEGPVVDECQNYYAVECQEWFMNEKQVPRLMNVKTAQRLNFKSG